MWESRRGDECLRQAVFSANGIRTHNYPGLNRMPLPVGLPRCIEYRFRAVVLCQAPPAGFEPAISTVTRWRALLAALRGRVRFQISDLAVHQVNDIFNNWRCTESNREARRHVGYSHAQIPL